MNIKKSLEVNLIKSRALAVLGSLLLSALILFPFIGSARPAEKEKADAMVFMHAFKSNKKASVSLYNFAEGKYTLTIEGLDGGLYYNTLLESAEGFKKVFDLSSLEDGDYSLNVKGKKGEETRRFTIENGEIKVFYHEACKPEFKAFGAKAIIEMANKAENPVTVKVVGENNQELWQSTFSGQQIRKVLNFTQLENGNYKVLVSSPVFEYAFDYTK